MFVATNGSLAASIPVVSNPTLVAVSSTTVGVSVSESYGAATSVQLSDTVKAVLARAETDQWLAERLQALVQAGRASDGQDPQAATVQKIDVDQEFQRLSGGTAVSDAQTPEPVQVVTSFDSGLKADGYTISALASNRDGSSRIEIVGPNGFSFLDERFGSSGEFVGGSSAESGNVEAEYQAGNVEYVTISQSAAVSASSVASSSAGSVATSSSAAEASTTTIAIDFSTGQISLSQATAVQSTAAVLLSKPAPSFSTIA